MKTRKLFVVMVTVVLFVVMLTGCADVEATKLPYDTGITNDWEYNNTDFWVAENNIRLVTDIKVEIGDVIEPEFSAQQFAKMPKKNANTIERLKTGMISFFQERYKIDISEKIENQQVKFFIGTGESAEMMGFVEVGNKNVLNLNQILLKEYSHLFETTYVHETLHQIGFQADKNAIVEGITDALADMILCYIGIEPKSTPYYYYTRTVAYQLLYVDPEIVSGYLTQDNFDIIQRITDKLKDVPQPCRKNSNIGAVLEQRLELLYYVNQGMVSNLSTDPYWLAFECQEIVKAYCTTFNPDADTIKYIRSHYVIFDYEQISIIQEGDEYSFSIE